MTALFLTFKFTKMPLKFKILSPFWSKALINDLFLGSDNDNRKDFKRNHISKIESVWALKELIAKMDYKFSDIFSVFHNYFLYYIC